MTADAGIAARSTNAVDYQALPRPVAAMAKTFPEGHVIAPHAHERDQLLYAVSGVMRLLTDSEAWIVPPDRAVYIPAGTRHSVAMRGAVEMRTLYVEPGAAPRPPGALNVIEVSPFLRELILALLAEPVLYDEAGRGGALAKLILTEVSRARGLSYCVPMPSDPRLQRLCAAILEEPSSRRTLEEWSGFAGASPRTLARLFEREVCISFSVWRRRIRFHSALEALLRGDPVARVAERHGYRSASAFTSAFGRAMGVPPSRVAGGLAPASRRPAG